MNEIKSERLQALPKNKLLDLTIKSAQYVMLYERDKMPSEPYKTNLEILKKEVLDRMHGK